jgi:hypothetical protein
MVRRTGVPDASSPPKLWIYPARTQFRQNRKSVTHSPSKITTHNTTEANPLPGTYRQMKFVEPATWILRLYASSAPKAVRTCIVNLLINFGLWPIRSLRLQDLVNGKSSYRILVLHTTFLCILVTRICGKKLR